MIGSRPHRRSPASSARPSRPRRDWPATDGEINFLWSFMDGSIMVPETRERLHRAWGFCERHAWIALAVEMAYRRRFVMGSAVLYEDLMERAAHAARARGPFPGRQLSRRLGSDGPCLLCDLNVAAASGAFAPQRRLARGRGTAALRRFALDHESHWAPHVCGVCRPAGTVARCRPHLLADIRAGKPVDLAHQRAQIDGIRRHVAALLNAYCAEFRDTDTAEDRAALLRAVGWCSGWRPLLTLTAIRDAAPRASICKGG